MSAASAARSAISPGSAVLPPEDTRHALQQFVPPGKYDDYLMFASGGHSGQVFVIGVPSMRVLETIAVFTPEPWQGYGYGSDWGDTILEKGNPRGEDLTWGDTHHPALSETNGEYDGPLALHQRQGERTLGHDRPARYAREADRGRAELRDVARRHVRDAELRVRPHFLQIPDALARDRPRLFLGAGEIVRVLAIVHLEPDLQVLGPFGAYVLDSLGITAVTTVLGGALVVWLAGPGLAVVFWFSHKR